MLRGPAGAGLEAMATNGACHRTSLATLALVLGAAAGALAWQRLAFVALVVGMLLKFAPVGGTGGGLASRWFGIARKACPTSSSSSSLVPMSASNGSFSWEEVRPPLPESVVALLLSTRLGYLSTATTEAEGRAGSTPHLSLMNFTYVRGDEVIIMTTRKNTQKYQNLLSYSRVALLVHDFPTQRGTTEEQLSRGGGYNRTYSITLYGTVRMPDDPQQEERYRQIHLENNPSSQCFIVGDGIAVLVICVESARLCNAEDKVTTWSAPSNTSAA